MLVIGATGILRPAVHALVGSGRRVVAVARNEVALAELAATARTLERSVITRPADARQPDALAAALSGLDLDAAIAYGPAMSARSWVVLAERVAGPVVQVLPSSVAAPDAPALESPRPPFIRLVLGWTADLRWHTAVQVSAAAVAAMRDHQPGHAEVLGRLRPWSHRPA